MRKFVPDPKRENEVLWGHEGGFEHVQKGKLPAEEGQ